jgi:hypothetical protein
MRPGSTHWLMGSGVHSQCREDVNFLARLDVMCYAVMLASAGKTSFGNEGSVLFSGLVAWLGK